MQNLIMIIVTTITGFISGAILGLIYNMIHK
jgi:hypothetical protein